MFNLIYKLDKMRHEIEEKDESISELMSLLKFRTDENKSLYKEINRLCEVIEKQNQKIGEMQKEIERLHKVFDIKDGMRIELVKENKTLKNDYKKCYTENVRLSEENNQLKFRNKMLINTGINSVYGMFCCKNHCVYTDTDIIKAESEEKKHVDNN